MAFLTRFVTVATVAAALAAPAVAEASTPPLTPEELAAASDLIVHARAVDASCAGEPYTDPHDAQVTLTPYATTLDVLEVVKGGRPRSVEVRGESVLFNGEESSCYETPAAVQAGTVATFYLRSINRGAAYQIVHYNGVEQSDADIAESAPEALPTCSVVPPPEKEEEDEEWEGDDYEDDIDWEDHDCGGMGCSASATSAGGGFGWLAGLALVPLLRRRRAR